MLNKFKSLVCTIKGYLKGKKKGGAYTTEIAAIVLIVLLVCVLISADKGTSGGIGTIWSNMKTGINSAITKATAHFE